MNNDYTTSGSAKWDARKGWSGCKAGNGCCDVCGWEAGCGMTHAQVRALGA